MGTAIRPEAPSTAPVAPAPPAPPAAGYRATCTGPVRCSLEGTVLAVPPFRLPLGRQAYLSREPIRIDLAQVAPGSYRVVAVHNFHVEDRNPRLDECVAGIFLAARLGDGWEEPERFPVECRALAVLGEVEVPAAPGGAGGAP